ncbi:hypothetical protein Bca52824_052320 [Brassica carinata]|uniref:DC1 domain-containing protein n=1 Tax=Brassica carinata TaxID=52824 RepID=A0A8X7UIM0_BRACI|nr:hypothetical protein Bca52824_052320 [Brassica carinata]
MEKFEFVADPVSVVLKSRSLYYKCKDCEIFLDLGCAILNNIKTSSYAEEKLHYSHAHFLRRCKPGPDARGSCLMCELPLTPSAVSYGCSQCYLFAHERCLDLSSRDSTSSASGAPSHTP